MATLPDPTEPLTEWEKALMEKLLADPTLFPAKFKAWMTDYVGVNAEIHIDSMPSLSGEEWQDVGDVLGFSNSWVDLDTDRQAKFMKDVLGFVHLEGIIKSGTLVTTAFTLPEGYRPETGSNAHFPTSANTAYGEVYITSAGAVVPYIGSTTHFSLYGITFRAA